MGTADPKKLDSPRNNALDAFSNTLRDSFSGKGAAGADLGSWVQEMFKMPAYDGDLSAPANPAETSAMGYVNDAAKSFYSPGGTGQDLTTQLTQILKDQGPSINPDEIRAGLDPARKVSLNRDLGQMEEQFGVQGLAGGTSIAESGARAVSDSESNMMAQITQMLPQLAQARATQGGVRLGAADALGKGNMAPAQQQFAMGEGMRGIQDEHIQRALQEFLRQSNLFPQLLSFLSGTPQQPYGPSPLDSALKVAQTGVAGVAAATA